MKSVEPRLACGVYFQIVYIVSLVVEITTGFPLLSKYIKYVGLFGVVTVFFIYPIVASNYNSEDNDNTKIYIFSIFLVIMILLGTVAHFNK